MRRLLFEETYFTTYFFNYCGAPLREGDHQWIWGINARSEIQNLVYVFSGLRVGIGGAVAALRTAGRKRI